jgi:hypothetical protein
LWPQLHVMNYSLAMLPINRRQDDKNQRQRPDANWKEMSSRLEHELKELAKEEERQKLLDALSESNSRNTELEIALAKLARDQDRIAILERERILKRAQVAQATAAIVHEANWARTRMESEMRQTKLRAMVFPEPVPLSPQHIFPEAITTAPPVMSSSAIIREAKEKQTSSRHDQPSHISPPSIEHPSTSFHGESVSSSKQSEIPVENSPREPPTQIQPQPSTLPAPVVNPQQDISDIVSAAATSVLDNLTSYVRASFPTENSNQVGEKVSYLPDEPKEKPVSPHIIEFAPTIQPNVPATMPPLPAQEPRIQRQLLKSPPIASTPKASLKTIPDSSSKGLWTNSQLFDLE